MAAIVAVVTCDETGDSDGPIVIESLAEETEPRPPQPVDQVQACSKRRRANDSRPEIAPGAPGEELGKGGNLERVGNGTILYDPAGSGLGSDEIFSRPGVFPATQDINWDQRYPEECDETKYCKGHHKGFRIAGNQIVRNKFDSGAVLPIELECERWPQAGPAFT